MQPENFNKEENSMESMKLTPFLTVVVLLAVIIALTAGSVSAGTFAVGPLMLVSGPSPFAACTIGGSGSSVKYVNAEVEPQVAVNPTNPNLAKPEPNRKCQISKS